MKCSRASTPARIVAAVALALLAGIAGAQSYGPDDQVLTVGVAELQGYKPIIAADGYLYNNGRFSEDYRASIRVPQGALIERLCLYSHGNGTTQTAIAQMVADKLVLGGGGGSAEIVIPGSVVQSAAIDGYGLFCSDPFAFTVPGTIDVEGDGGQDSVQLSVDVVLPPDLAVGAVKITWRRQVSPQPAEPTFGDVPLDSPYSPFIEALMASGITGGCQLSPLLYCPDRPITRAEMAVFVAKALGLHWDD